MIDKPEPNEHSIDLTGRKLGEFTVLRRLGRGGMAEVYLARQESLNRNVALKILKPHLAQDKSYVERFHREAQSAARLVQSNIVGVYEVGQIEDLHYIAQEYVIGRNLREYISRNGAVKPIMAINVLRQVAMALQKADQNNVTHRDIKPENIMLSPGGEVKVADFGLARVQDEQNKHLTQIGITMGTPLYMSPEQVEGKQVDVRSDIYSLGVTAFHMLAGQPPFDGENSLAIAIQHVRNEPPNLGQIRPDLPVELVDLIQSMMAKAPKLRPANALVLLSKIKQIQVEDEGDWDHLVETLAIESSPSRTTNIFPESRLAATQQLQSIMNRGKKTWWMETSTWLVFAFLVVAGGFIGLWTANHFPVQNPLASINHTVNNIRRFESAREQYEHAINFHPKNIDYYDAVLKYHPFDETDTNKNFTQLYRNRAKERMAEIYLLRGEFQLATKIYNDFQNVENSERINVVGAAGKAIVYHRLGKAELAKRAIQEIESEVEGTLNRFLARQFDEIRRHYF